MPDDAAEKPKRRQHTPEQLERIRQRSAERYANRTPEEIERKKLSRRKAANPERYAKRLAVDRLRAQARPPKERERYEAETWQRKWAAIQADPQRLAAFRAKRAVLNAKRDRRAINLSPEQVEHIREYNRLRWVSRTPEEIERYRERDRQRHANRTPEEIARRRERWQERYAARTPEQIQRDREKWLADAARRRERGARQGAEASRRQRDEAEASMLRFATRSPELKLMAELRRACRAYGPNGDDMVSEAVLALLEGRAQTPAEAAKIGRAAHLRAFSDYGTVSMDQPMWADGPSYHDQY